MTPSDPDWDAARQVFNLATDLRPAAVALPRDVRDVVAAVGYARAHGLRVAPQATGHNAGAHGVARGHPPRRRPRAPGGLHRPRGARRVRVGAGVKWERRRARLSELGLAALHGSSPRRRHRRLLARRRHGLARPQARPAGEQRHRDRARHRRRARVRASTPSTSPSSSGRCAAAAATSASSPRSSSTSTPVEELYAGALFFPFERAGEVLHAWRRSSRRCPTRSCRGRRSCSSPTAPFVPEPVRGGLVHRRLGRLPRRARPRAASCCGRCGTWARRWTPSRWCRRPRSATWRWTRPIRCRSSATTALLTDLPAVGVDELVFAVGPGSGTTLDACRSCVSSAAPSAGETPGAGARATLPGELSLFALGVSGGRRPRRRRGATSSVDGPSALPRRRLPELRRGAGRHEPLLRRGHVGAAARAKALYDPSDLFQGNHHIPPAE